MKDKLSELLQGPDSSGATDATEQPSTIVPVGLTQLLGVLHGNQDHFRRILELYLRATETDMQSLVGASQGGDRRLAGELAHKLKSSCSQLGQHAASGALEEIKRAALSVRVDDASFDRLVMSAKREVSRAQALLEEYLTTGKAEP